MTHNASNNSNHSSKPFTAVELTSPEKELLKKINFNALEIKDHIVARTNGTAVLELTKSLVNRKAIPQIRISYFTNPDLNIGGNGSSYKNIFEKNGTRGDEIFLHTHFLKFLHYFIYGANLPAEVVISFYGQVKDCGTVTSGDVIPLGKHAKQLVRQYQLEPRQASEEFFKFALECDLVLHEARSVRDAVKSMK